MHSMNESFRIINLDLFGAFANFVVNVILNVYVFNIKSGMPK